MRKANQKKATQLNFRSLFRNKRLPILTLDERWLSLFSEYNMPDHVRKLRDELNELLKKQGKATEEIKGLKRYKEQLMQEIVTNMEVDDSMLGKLKGRKLEKNQKLILDVKEKLFGWEDELENLPYEIKEANEELMNASAIVCYERLDQNSEEMKQLDEDIIKMRNELKEKILRKQDLEEENASIYTYMHDVLGPNVMEALDNEILKR